MIDFHPTLRNALDAIGLPVHYEMVLHSGLGMPCLSYMELTNFVELQTDVTDVSRVAYQIKIWAPDIPTIQLYAPQVDSVMRQLGFRRTSSAELWNEQSGIISKILTYQALAEEKL